MPKYFMISNRVLEGGELLNTSGPLHYWTTDNDAVDQLANWTSCSADDFKKAVLDSTASFPVLPITQHEDQQHVTLFIHGYNNTWQDAAKRYQSIVANLFSGDGGLGLCILFCWPSDGAYLGYYPDRVQSRDTAPYLSAVLNEFYDWLMQMQKAAMRNPANACNAKTWILAHSMGNERCKKRWRSPGRGKINRCWSRW